MTKRELIEDSDVESYDSEDISRDYLRISVVLSFLTHKELSINLVDPIRPFEYSLLKLITRVSDGTRTEVDLNSIKMKPGLLTGGEFAFECDKSMPLSYYLEPLVLLLPFASKPTTVTLKLLNATPNSANSGSANTSKNTHSPASLEDEFLNNEYYSSLECFSSVCTILLQLVGCQCNFKYKEPYEVVFSCTPIRKVAPINLTRSPKLKRVRGSVTVRNIQPNLGKRAIIGAKKVLDIVCDNSFIYLSSPPGRFKPYLTMSLIAEGSQNCIFTSNATVSLFSDSASPSEGHSHSHSANSTTDATSTDGPSSTAPIAAKSGTSSLKKILNLIESSSGSSAPTKSNATATVPPNRTSTTTTSSNHTTTSSNHTTTSSNHTNTSSNHANSPSKAVDEGLLEKCERMGQQCAYRLCSEISLDSVVDTSHEHLFLFFMALAEDHRVSQLRLSKLTRYSVHCLRFIRRYLGVVFKFQELELENVLIVKCIGSNYQNINIESF